jgi:DNA polymerase III epsilon subunit family exonuclease
MNNQTFAVVDIETTGLSASYHKIIEIAALKYRNGKVIEKFSSLIDPKEVIPRFITRLTGIDNDMVKGMPTIDKVIPNLKDFISDLPFVAHNAGFDYRFLDNACYENLNVNLSNEKICTCRLARRLLPFLEKKKLGHICEHFGIENDAAHRAMGDALVTAEIFGNFIEMMKEKEIHHLEDLHKFQKSKIPKSL